MSGHPHVENVFPNISLAFASLQLVTAASRPTAVHLPEEPGCVLSIPSHLLTEDMG